nr:MAG TPA: hypothetical protein [Caudoviricetes sp.]
MFYKQRTVITYLDIFTLESKKHIKLHHTNAYMEAIKDNMFIHISNTAPISTFLTCITAYYSILQQALIACYDLCRFCLFALAVCQEDNALIPHVTQLFPFVVLVMLHHKIEGFLYLRSQLAFTCMVFARADAFLSSPFGLSPIRLLVRHFYIGIACALVRWQELVRKRDCAIKTLIAHVDYHIGKVIQITSDAELYCCTLECSADSPLEGFNLGKSAAVALFDLFSICIASNRADHTVFWNNLIGRAPPCNTKHIVKAILDSPSGHIRKHNSLISLNRSSDSPFQVRCRERRTQHFFKIFCFCHILILPLSLHFFSYFCFYFKINVLAIQAIDVDTQHF